MNRPSDAVQSDLVSCSQCLDAAYSGNHFVLECDGSFGDDLVDDSQRAVVERRIAPHQKGTAFPVSELLLDQPLVYGNSLRVPCPDAGLIGWRVSVARGIGGFDGPVRPVLDVARADVLAKTDQVVFLG